MKPSARSARSPAPSPAYAQARAASYDTDLVLNKMAAFVKSEKESGDKSAVTYRAANSPNGSPSLAAMLHTGMPIKCASLNAVGSYDTHSDEAGTLTTNLAETVAAVVAFQRDLEARKLDQRVLIQLWSEFGRRPRENGSGTDHGAGGNAFLIGSRASGKMVGEFPGLTNLDENENVLRTSDFRAMYCSLLEQWFETEAGLVIPEAASFERPVSDQELTAADHALRAAARRTLSRELRGGHDRNRRARAGSLCLPPPIPRRACLHAPRAASPLPVPPRAQAPLGSQVPPRRRAPPGSPALRVHPARRGRQRPRR